LSLTYLYRRNYFCNECKLIGKKGVPTEHCDYCEVCVENLDHHCPWSSKCIARGNLVPFNIFINALLIHIIVLVVATMILVAGAAGSITS
jgi:hypothetical protein